ncbi:MAG: tetratricopeptide repeat protein [Acidobacteria bacterium]|nr:tetratricopeptide repeat protein [Acidobacteriota bacterium]
MFTSRNLHFLVLGVILGATSGYIFAFYQVQSTTPPPRVLDSGMPPGHPNVDNEQMLAFFKEAMDRNPDDPKLLTRYGNFLLTIDRYAEAIQAYQKVLEKEPDNQDVRTDMATAYWNMGQRDKAMEEYNKSLEVNPKHVYTLHTMFFLYIEGRRDIKSAEDMLRRIEEADPKYEHIPALKKQLETERARLTR